MHIKSIPHGIHAYLYINTYLDTGGQINSDTLHTSSSAEYSLSPLGA